MNRNIDLIKRDTVSHKKVRDKNQLKVIVDHFFNTDSPSDIFVRQGIKEDNEDVIRFVKAFIVRMNLR